MLVYLGRGRGDLTFEGHDKDILQKSSYRAQAICIEEKLFSPSQSITAAQKRIERSTHSSLRKVLFGQPNLL